jgi:hypothetical protein
VFRFLTLLGFTVIALDLAFSAFETRRVRLTSDVFVERMTDPMSYWLFSFFWSALAAFSLVGIPVLALEAITGRSLYFAHPFFSWNLLWPYGLTTALFGIIAIKIVRRRLTSRRPSAKD